jgi:aerobic carbon-monoxide dehydrogenase large subunit
MVVADTVYAAKNGAEAIEIDYEILPAVVETVPAARQDAPRVHEGNPSNVCFDSNVGNFDATEAAFARAAHVTRFETWVQRITGVPMEPRAALAEYDKATNRFTVYAGNGGAFRLKGDLAKMLDVPPEQVRVLMQDVGGNFGTRHLCDGTAD